MTSGAPLHRPGADKVTILAPYQHHLLVRLERLLAVAPSADERWQSRLVARAIRSTLDECGRHGLDDQATRLMRAAGRGQAPALEEPTEASVS